MALQLSFTDGQDNVYPKAYFRVNRLIYDRVPGNGAFDFVAVAEWCLYKNAAAAQYGKPVTVQYPDGSAATVTPPPRDPVARGSVVLRRSDVPDTFDALIPKTGAFQVAQAYAYIKTLDSAPSQIDGRLVAFAGAVDV